MRSLSLSQIKAAHKCLLEAPVLTVDDQEIEKIKLEYDKKMEDLANKYREEMESNARLKEDMDKMKNNYEQRLVVSSQGAPDQAMALLDHNHNDQSSDLREMQAQAIERLQELQGQMVGGEKVDDHELKEKRAKRKKIAEKKINAISDALSKLDDDDRLLLKAYGDITEELRARTILLKKAKKKIQALEQEVNDLQSEFESDRTGMATSGGQGKGNRYETPCETTVTAWQTTALRR